MTNAKEISSLINKDKWGNILTKLKNNNITVDTLLNNGNWLCHLATLNNKIEIIKYYLKSKKGIECMGKTNNAGESSYHIMAKYGYIDLLKLTLPKDKYAINLIDGDGNTALYYLIKNPNNYFEWVVDNIHNIDYSKINNNSETLLTHAISLSNNENDIYYKRIKLLIKKKINLNHPKSNYPLIKSINENKTYITNELIDKGVDINVKGKSYFSPLLFSIYRENILIIKKLIDKGVDVNYFGPEGDNNPMTLMIGRENQPIIQILLDNGFDINKYDRDFNTPVHLAFQSNKILNPSLVSVLLFYGNLNQKNANNQTILQLFLKKYDWRNYTKILETKNLDLSNNDINTNINNEDVNDFLNLVVDGFINNNNKACSKLKSIECKNKIKKNILKDKTKINNINNDIKLIVGQETIIGKFNSDILHNIIYTIIILKRHNNLGIPFQYFNKTKALTQQMLINTSNFLRDDKSELIIYEIVKLYNEYFFELSPYLIIWRNKNLHNIDKYLDLYLQKSLKSDKIRFVFFKLTLISSGIGTHANIILYDKYKGILERFEPYGIIPYLDNNDIDTMIKNNLKPIFEKYNKTFIYYGPKELYAETNVGFQIISNDGDNSVKKLGDPTGFCLAWTFWYIDMRLKNPEIDPRKLVTKSFNKIISRKRLVRFNSLGNDDDNKYNDQIFINFIRDYAGKLDEDKNKLLIDAGVDKKHIYDLQYNNQENAMIFKYLVNKFNDLMNKRIS
jgi:ankyrin repeat protein